VQVSPRTVALELAGIRKRMEIDHSKSWGEERMDVRKVSSQRIVAEMKKISLVFQIYLKTQEIWNLVKDFDWERIREVNSRPLVLTRRAKKIECCISRYRYLSHMVVRARFWIVPSKEAPSRRVNDFLLGCQVDERSMKSFFHLSGVMPTVRAWVLIRTPSCFLRVCIGKILNEPKQLLVLVHDSREIVGRLQVLRENRTYDGKDFLSVGADCSAKWTADKEKKVWAYYEGVGCHDIWV